MHPCAHTQCIVSAAASIPASGHPHLCSQAPSRACASRTTKSMRRPAPSRAASTMSATSTSAGVSCAPLTAGGRAGRRQAGWAVQHAGMHPQAAEPRSWIAATVATVQSPYCLRPPPHTCTAAGVQVQRQLVVCRGAGPWVLPPHRASGVGCDQLEVHSVPADVQQRQPAQQRHGGRNLVAPAAQVTSSQTVRRWTASQLYTGRRKLALK